MKRRPFPAWGRMLPAFVFARAVSMEAGSLSLNLSVLPGGGGSSSSASYSVDGSIGQPVAADLTSNSATYSERAGFWSQANRWIGSPPIATADVVERRAGDSTHVLIKTLLANDSGTDLEILRFVSADSSTSAGGIIYRDGPFLVYQPPDTGPDPLTDTFTYRVRDALGIVSTGTVQIKVSTPQIPTPPNATSIEQLVGPPASIRIHFLAIPNRSYQAQTATNPAGPWANTVLLTAASDGSMTYTTPTSAGPHYFRIVEAL